MSIQQPTTINTSSIKTVEEKKNFCDRINDEIGDSYSIQYFKIPDNINLNIEGRWENKYVEYLKNIIPGFKENPTDIPVKYHTHDISIRNPKKSQGLDSEYHREFHPAFNKINQPNEYGLIVLFYYSLGECKGPCGTQFLFQDVNKEFKEFIFPAESGDIIVVKDCKFLHKTPNIMQNIDRKIIRSYVTTEDNKYEPLSCPDLKKYWKQYMEFSEDQENLPPYLEKTDLKTDLKKFGGFYRSKRRRSRNRKSKKTRKSRKNRRKSKRRSPR